jgi:hypothetical protein
MGWRALLTKQYNKGMLRVNDRRNAAVGCAREIDEAQTGVVETLFAKVVFEVQLSQEHFSMSYLCRTASIRSCMCSGTFKSTMALFIAACSSGASTRPRY